MNSSPLFFGCQSGVRPTGTVLEPRTRPSVHRGEGERERERVVVGRRRGKGQRAKGLAGEGWWLEREVGGDCWPVDGFCAAD
jgi:hypothetical protein